MPGHKESVGEVRIPLIRNSLDNLERTIEGLGQWITQLEERLSDVIQPAPPTQHVNIKEPSSAVVLVARIDVLTSKIQILTERLKDLVEQVEV